MGVRLLGIVTSAQLRVRVRVRAFTKCPLIS